MIDITSFLLKHLYEFMADNYNATEQRDNELALRRQQQPRPASRQQQQRAERPWSPDSLGQLEEQSPGGPDEEEAGQPLVSDTKRPLDCCPPHRAQSDSGSRSSTQAQMVAAATTTNNQTATSVAGQSQRESTGPLAFLKRSLSGACHQQTESSRSSWLVAREQETNQQIVSFLINNQLPDLACETLIELIFISVFLAISWIFVMIIQLHCQQSAGGSGATPTNVMDQLVDQTQRQHSYESARHFYCNTKFLNSLMYCNNRDSRLFAS